MDGRLGFDRKPTKQMVLIKGTLTNPNDIHVIQECGDNLKIERCIADDNPVIITGAKITDVKYVEIGPDGIISSEVSEQ